MSKMTDFIFSAFLTFMAIASSLVFAFMASFIFIPFISLIGLPYYSIWVIAIVAALYFLSNLNN